MSRPTYFSACLLGIGLTALNTAIADSEGTPVTVIQPAEQTTSIRPAVIDGGQFEFGPYVGFLSVEDFNTNLVAGLSLSYHVNSRLLAQFNYGRSTTERATFEDISGDGENFLSEGDRDFHYQSLLAGYNLMPGRSFLGERRKFNSYIYLMAGAGRVSFAGEDNTGLVLGINYKTVLREWLTVNLDFRDVIVDRAFLGNNKTTHNIEMTLGISALF